MKTNEQNRETLKPLLETWRRLYKDAQGLPPSALAAVTEALKRWENADEAVTHVEDLEDLMTPDEAAEAKDKASRETKQAVEAVRHAEQMIAQVAKGEQRTRTGVSLDKAPEAAMNKRAGPNRPKLSFTQLGLRKGDELFYVGSEGVKATISDPDQKMVVFEGEIIHISAATKIMQKRRGRALSVSSNHVWKFNGRKLVDISEEKYREMGLG